MTSARKPPLDQAVRDRLVAEFHTNLLVEAGAGSGKTHSLATRMAAGIAAGAYEVEHMAAVTFTRKAAAELRGRFRGALEARLASATDAAERARVERALHDVERLFAGTIHAFCAHLLRERPIDADMAPGFVELDDLENLRRQRRAWHDYVASARAAGFAPLLDLLEAGIRTKDLYGAFGTVCEHEDVEFVQGNGHPPAFGPALAAVEKFWEALGALAPSEFPEATTCPVQAKFWQVDGWLKNVRRQRRLASLAALIDFWGHPEVRQKWWSAEVGRDKSYGARAKALVEEFDEDVVTPFQKQWRAYVHRLALQVLDQARRAYAGERRRQNVANYVDLLRCAARMLRTSPEVRHALRQKYRWLFIDEFQDTDPIQAEIFLVLAAEDAPEDSTAAGASPVVADPFALPLRPGALFVVGDPKQSIYRFRRADIDVYTRVRDRIVATGGEALILTANFRSRPGICTLANTVFTPLFGAVPAPYSPAYEPLHPVMEDPPGAGPSVATLTVASDGTPGEVVAREADRIAAFIRAAVAAGERRYEDFLVVTRQKPRLRVYAEAFDRLDIPVEVSGAGLFRKSPEVRALALLLAALADPLDAVSLVGVLRGPLFGLSDPELFQYRRAGQRFELTTPLPEPSTPREAAEFDKAFGPALAAMRQLQGLLRTTRRLPLAAAVERILEETGLLALACTTPGGAGAGHLVQAVDRVREVAEQGGGLLDAAAALDEEEVSSEAEALPLRPGRRDVVRLMNLHKAKGLEAPVVFLADPAHEYEFPAVTRIVREGGAAKGHIKIVKPAMEGKGPRGKTIGEAAGWEAHEEEERKYHQAERLRLLYVAGTRAKDLLVVCRLDASAKNDAWDVFEPWLRGAPELRIPAHVSAPKPKAPAVSTAARAEAREMREAAHERTQKPSWAEATPTGLHALAPAPAAATALEVPAPAVLSAHGPAVEASAGRGDAGAAWGALVHGLLEHAMRHHGATRDDLARLARWLTVETPEVHPHVPQALDLVEVVTQAPFWAEARDSAELCVEVPFAVRVEAGEAVPGGAPVTTPTVLRGVIDLVYRAADGWRIVDYKSDQAGEGADADALLRVRHGAQVEQYRFAWGRVAEGPVAAPMIFGLRGLREVVSTEVVSS